MKTMPKRFNIGGSCFSIEKNIIKQYGWLKNHQPSMGDLVYCEVDKIGFHKQFETPQDIIKNISRKTKIVCTIGNRYATSFGRGFVPNEPTQKVDMLSRSCVVGYIDVIHETHQSPTKFKILGYILDENKKVINTINHKKIVFNSNGKRKSKIILVVGTTMNSGKTTTVSKICEMLLLNNRTVSAAKLTGIGCVGDMNAILMSGINNVYTFQHLGYPSTYLLNKNDLYNIFNVIDSNIESEYFVIEIADGILQRETKLLLENPEIKQRIHKLIYCEKTSTGLIGGLNILKKYDLYPDYISGMISSNHLLIEESLEYVKIKIFNNLTQNINLEQLGL